VHIYRIVSTLLLLLLPLFSQEKPKNIAVADLDAIGESEQDVSVLTNKLRNDLILLGTYNVIERGDMDKILAEQKFQQTGCTSQECAVEIGQLLNVSHIVSGSISKLSTLHYVNVKLINVQTGQVEVSFEEKIDGDITQVFEIAMPSLAAKLSNSAKIAKQAKVKKGTTKKQHVQLSPEQKKKRRNLIIKITSASATAVALGGALYYNHKFDSYQNEMVTLQNKALAEGNGARYNSSFENKEALRDKARIYRGLGYGTAGACATLSETGIPHVSISA